MCNESRLALSSNFFYKEQSLLCEFRLKLSSSFKTLVIFSP